MPPLFVVETACALAMKPNEAGDMTILWDSLHNGRCGRMQIETCVLCEALDSGWAVAGRMWTPRVSLPHGTICRCLCFLLVVAGDAGLVSSSQLYSPWTLRGDA